MDDDIGARELQSLWIDWAGHIVSFHEETGYERLEFPTTDEMMEYVVRKSRNGFRIQ